MEDELAVQVGLLWAIAYACLLAVVFGIPVWWGLKRAARWWVLCDPRLRLRRGGYLIGVFTVLGALATLSESPVPFLIVCYVLGYGATYLERRGVL